jgi:hypothetical protein
MRMIPARSLMMKPVAVKGQASQVKHFGAPIKGLNLSTELSQGDPMTASILTNFILYDDRIAVRPGWAVQRTLPVTTATETLIPYTADSFETLLAANGLKVYNASTGAVIGTGFTGNDWSHTMFANLGNQKYVVMANGFNGVWSFDGATMVKEAITADPSITFFNQDNVHIVLSHMNRIFMADKANLCVFYLPLLQKSGAVKQLPLGTIFKKGGSIAALASWSIDGGDGIDDKLAIFTTEGQMAIYSGFDPDSNFELVGVFSFDKPMHKNALALYGGDLYAQVTTGLVPMSVVIRDQTESLGKYDKGIQPGFLARAKFKNRGGWAVQMEHSNGWFICNLPNGSTNNYTQYVRKMGSAQWVEWSQVPARSWAWFRGQLWFGTDDGRICVMDANYLASGSQATYVDCQLSWSAFGTPAYKHFKMIRPYIATDGTPRPFIDVMTDYRTGPPTNQPEVTFASPGGLWDLSDWDIDSWASGKVQWIQWQGCAGAGKVGAPRLAANVLGCELDLTGFDVIYERGSILG